ncbi:SDR family oxidoreductase [Rhizobium sp.]
MRVFVTGASGFVGSAVVQELLAAGHAVIGLARSDASAAALKTAGADVHRGDIDDLDSLRAGAEKSDGVIHCAFNHDFSRFQASCAHDGLVIAALASGLEGSTRPLVITSGIGVLPQGAGLLTEDVRAATGLSAHPRTATEHAADAAAAQGVKVSIIRLPPSTHGRGDHGFVPLLIGVARDKGLSAYSGEGLNRWPAVHRLDAARLYRLALEKGAAHARYHAVAEEGIPFRDIATSIGRGLGLPVESRSGEAAAAHFGWFSHFAAMDVPASSAWTKGELGWVPEHVGLIEDVESAGYFAA